MQFFVLDLALAFAALLGYRALGAVARERVAVLSPAGGRVEPKPAPSVRLWNGEPSSCTTSCGERPPHRLINFW